jgi:hypothetical protein
LFVTPPHILLECQICFNVIHDAVGCPSSHTFCRQCFISHLAVSKTCPTCRCSLKAAQLSPNVIVQGLIDDSDVYCFSTIDATPATEARTDSSAAADDTAAEKCGWTGKLKDAEDHYRGCPFGQTSCPHTGCTATVRRRDLANHQTVCPHRMVGCQWCHLPFQFNAVTSHEDLCDHRIIACPNGCCPPRVEGGDEDRVDDVTYFPLNQCLQHLAVCPLQETDCCFASVGCGVRMKRKDIAQHEQDASVHFSKVVGVLVERQARLETEVAVLRQRVEDLSRFTGVTTRLDVACVVSEDGNVSLTPTTGEPFEWGGRCFVVSLASINVTTLQSRDVVARLFVRARPHTTATATAIPHAATNGVCVTVETNRPQTTLTTLGGASHPRRLGKQKMQSAEVSFPVLASELGRRSSLAFQGFGFRGSSSSNSRTEQFTLEFFVRVEEFVE